MSKYEMSQRRACRLVSVDPKTVRRIKIPDNLEIRARMRETASERRRFGYRRIGQMLEHEGIKMNHKKLRRLYREESLAVKRRRGRKRATGIRAPIDVPTKPNERWSLDFLSDAFEPGRQFRSPLRASLSGSLMTVRGNVLASSPTHRSQARVLPVSSTSSFGSTANRKQSSAREIGVGPKRAERN